MKLSIVKEPQKKKKKLNRGKRYYENNKERLLEHAKNKYRELSNEKKKNIKREYIWKK